MRVTSTLSLFLTALILFLADAVPARAVAASAPGSPDVAGLQLYRQGRDAEAADILRQALEESGAAVPTPAVPAPEALAPKLPTPHGFGPKGFLASPAETEGNTPSVSVDEARLRAVLGFALLEQNRLGEAEEQFAMVRRAVAVEGLDGLSIRAVGTLGLGWSAFVRGRTQNAADLLKEAVREAAPPAGGHPLPDVLVESVPGHARLGLGLIALGRGRPAAAAKLLLAATKGPDVFGSGKELRLALGDARAALGDVRGALAAWAEVPRSDSHFPADAGRDELARLKGARLLEAKGDRKAALAAYADLSLGRFYAPQALQGQARIFLAQGRTAEALPVLRRLVALEPSLAEPLRNKIEADAQLRPLHKDWGLAYFHRGQYTAALADLSAYLRDAGDDYDCRTAAGWSFLRLGEAARARTAFAAAAALRPKAADPLAGEGAAALAQGQTAEARALLERALAARPGDALALNALGHLELAGGDSEKALADFRASLKSRPDYVESRLAVAHILFGRAEYEAAATEYSHLVAQEKRSTAGWNGLGWAQLRLGRYDAARQAFAEAQRINPNQPAGAYGLGIAYARQGRTKEALRYLAESIFLNPAFSATPEVLRLMQRPEYTELFLEMGEAYARRLYPTSAAPYLEKYLGLTPNSRPGRRALGWASFWAGQEDKAHALFRTLLIVNKNDADANLGDGLALLSRDHLAMAEPHLRAAVRQDPDNPLAWRALALLLHRSGRKVQAAEVLQEEPKSRLQRLDSMSARGFAALEESRVRDAMADFRRAEALDPGLAAPHYGLAFALESLGDPNRARRELLAGMNLDPAYLDEEALRRLIAEHVDLGGLGPDLAWSQLYALNLPAAADGFRRILAATPGNMGALFGLGETAYLQGDWSLAESCFDKLLPHAPATAPSWDKWSHLMDKLGWAAYHQKKYTKALHAFDWLRTYHQHSPYAEALAGMGWSLLAKKHYHQAQDLFVRSLGIFPHNLTALNGLRALEKATSSDEEDFDESEGPLPEQKLRHRTSEAVPAEAVPSKSVPSKSVPAKSEAKASEEKASKSSKESKEEKASSKSSKKSRKRSKAKKHEEAAEEKSGEKTSKSSKKNKEEKASTKSSKKSRKRGKAKKHEEAAEEKSEEKTPKSSKKNKEEKVSAKSSKKSRKRDKAKKHGEAAEEKSEEKTPKSSKKNKEEKVSAKSSKKSRKRDKAKKHGEAAEEKAEEKTSKSSKKNKEEKVSAKSSKKSRKRDKAKKHEEAKASSAKSEKKKSKDHAEVKDSKAKKHHAESSSSSKKRKKHTKHHHEEE